jgi:hypothetical protein
MGKIGSLHAWEMLDRGRRELGGILYHDSNVAQPMYPPRGGYEPAKEAESQSLEEQGSILDDRLKQAEMHRDDEGRDDRDKGFDRE